MARERAALITGTLAAPALRRVAAAMEKQQDLDLTVVVLKIQVAALMTADWLGRKLNPAQCGQVDRVILPGYVRGELDPLTQKLGVTVQRGPKDLRELPAFFSGKYSDPPALDQYDIEILAEINEASGLDSDQLLTLAKAYAAEGADVIDLGCDPQADRPAWTGVGQAVKMLRDQGLRVSIDSFQQKEVAAACAAGAELVLSVNSSNRDAAADWGTPVVAIPDQPDDLASLEATINHLEKHGVTYRIDPIVEPIGFGFARSLGRYLAVRDRYPRAAMMMGIGNLTEMTEVDSAGVNMLLIGFCQELGIQSVLTTQVINWARSSVREIDLARRVMHHSVTQKVAPKHLSDQAVMLRDVQPLGMTSQVLERIAKALTDRNVRIFTDPRNGELHAMNCNVHAKGEDPFVIFDELGIDDASHAFYLGYEMAKAVTALTLHKHYVQDQALRWGMLTREEISHHDRRKGHKP